MCGGGGAFPTHGGLRPQRDDDGEQGGHGLVW